MIATELAVKESSWLTKVLDRPVAVISLIALVLVWFYVRQVGTQIAALQPMPSMMQSHVDAQGRGQAAMLYYMQQLCIQGAKMARTDARDCTYKAP